MILVGALWGCTNPLLRQGAIESSSSQTDTDGVTNTEDSSRPSSSTKPGILASILAFLSKLKTVSVWLPYAMNQSGSLLYYVTLAQSNLSLAVPICNALALVFSILTSLVLGERIHNPIQTVVGAALVVGGVTLCLYSAEQQQHEDHATMMTTEPTTKEEL